MWGEKKQLVVELFPIQPEAFSLEFFLLPASPSVLPAEITRKQNETSDVRFFLFVCMVSR